MTETAQTPSTDLSDALDFDLFEGDFGEPGDSCLSNKIVAGRGVYVCHICHGDIQKGEIHLSAAYIFSAELHSYRVCNACCVAMVASVTADYEDEDPVHERYALGEERRKENL
ncbi:MAG: hypothetical protein ACOH2G_05130 [Ewingella sp.]